LLDDTHAATQNVDASGPYGEFGEHHRLIEERRPTAEDQGGGRMARILIVDDDVVFLRVLAGLLTRKGHAVQTVERPRPALVALDHECFDILVSDVHMPEMDGFDLVREARERSKTMPAILTSADAEEGMAMRCLAAGATAFVSKSAGFAALCVALEDVLLASANRA